MYMNIYKQYTLNNSYYSSECFKKIIKSTVSASHESDAPPLP